MTPIQVQPSPRAFTQNHKVRIVAIITPINLSLPFDPKNTQIDTVNRVIANALWDTGATNCCITKEKADEVGLKPFTKAPVSYGRGTKYEDVYKLNIVLPNGVGIARINATECDSTQGNFDFIIGMDIITMGDLAITNVGGFTTVSFRFPPVRTIDYKLEIENAKTSDRNSPCPCGSGEKTKNCCGR